MTKVCRKVPKCAGIYRYQTNSTTNYVGQSKNIRRRHSQHKSGKKSRVDKSFRKLKAWPKPDILEVISQDRQKDYFNARERYFIKKYNTYFRGLNETPGGNIGMPTKPGPNQMSAMAENLNFYRKLKNLPMPGEHMTGAQKDFFKYLKSRKPLPRVFTLTIDLSNTGAEEAYSSSRSHEICQREWDRYRYYFADERADSIELGSFVYRNRSML